MSVPWQQWELMRRKDETDTRMDYQGLLAKATKTHPDLEAQLTSEVWQQRWEATQAGIKKVGKMLQQAAPLDAIIIFGDDQHEQFGDENMPAVAIYHGETNTIKVKDRGVGAAPWWDAEAKSWENKKSEYAAHPELAKHLIKSLTDQEFEVTRCSELRPNLGIGHAFAFLYRRVWPECDVPVVPVMVNTYYPPNQPTPKRCYNLGQAVRKALEGWDGGKRVAVMASGGLSHVIMDEEIDKLTVEGLVEQDVAKLTSLPRERLRGGTSEILNWVAVAGAAEHLKSTLIDYIPAYRSPAATGCGVGFASWN
jgi:hypothetical protein